jgi:hypothetical protein
MNGIKIIVLFLVSINANEIICQVDSSNNLIAQLYDVHMVSDGFSRYSNPKISPDGNLILTMRNRDTLIYIDIHNKSEIVLLTGGNFPIYYWIDDSMVYFQKRSEVNSTIYGEGGKINIETRTKKIDFNFSRPRNSNKSKIERIPILLKGKFDVYFDLYRNKVYWIKNGQEQEITHEVGIYFDLIVSNNEKNIIIHRNDGNAYKYDFNGNGEYIRIVNGLVTSWSPGDNYLLYIKGREINEVYYSELYICTSDGKKHQALTNTKDIKGYYPDWATKSNKITFIDNVNEQIYISRINVK